MPAPRRSPRRSAPQPRSLAELAGEVLVLPTASFLEHSVLAYLRRFADDRGLAYDEDDFGNAYVTYRKGRVRRPLVLGAHMDHPGFVVTAASGRRLDLEFRGGLSAEYGEGERLRLYSRNRDERGRARILSVEARETAGGSRFGQRLAGARAELEDGAAVEPGDLALWDVEPFRVRGDVVHARSCDDLGGCVGVLATLDRLAASGAPGHLVGLFTRAEEVGLLGAAAAARGGRIPRDAIVVAVETSSMAGGRAEQGEGPIIRVGDRQHIFSSRVTLWMSELAQGMADQDGAFRFQRKLMDGGTTEATAYDLLGYETGAACIALGNYHNAGARGRVRAETIDLGDLEGLVRLFERMHAELPRYERTVREAEQRWDRIGRDAERRLRETRR
jgi:putative aminopeptidase FrvX